MARGVATMFLAALVGLTGCDAVQLTADARDASDAREAGDARDANDARETGDAIVVPDDASTETGGQAGDGGAPDASADLGAETVADAPTTPDAAADTPAPAPDAATSDATDAPASDVAVVDAALEGPVADGATSEVSADASGASDASDAPAETAPACAMAFHDDWSKALSDSPEDGRPWYAPLGSPSTDENDLMMVGHYDSIQRAPLVGGYTMSFDLFIDGDLDFFVGMPAVSLDVPSLVRMGDKITLSGSHWGTTALVPLVEGDFDGRLVNDGPMRVTYYVKATSRACAMRVQLGSNTYRSGFVPCANGDTAVDGKDVSTPQLTGNASFGTGGYAHLGVIDGCAGLSDAAVATAYGP